MMASDLLRQRRSQVEITLSHVESERRECANNADWLNEAAYKNRMSLLDQIAAWYREELEDIDRAVRDSDHGAGKPPPKRISQSPALRSCDRAKRD